MGIINKIKTPDNETYDISTSWENITDKPALGTAASKDVPESGNASNSQVVMGNDTRLSDARPASNTTDTYDPTGTEPVSGKAVSAAIATIPGGGGVSSVTIQATTPIDIDSEEAITTFGTRTISHANSGVSAGTYQSVTVDTYGHVTNGTNPTTIADYGITDAKIENGVITLGNDTITEMSQAEATAGTATTARTMTAKVLNDTLSAKGYVTGGTTTDVPNISKKTVVTGVTPNTVVTAASGATATVSGSTLILTNGIFSIGDSCTVTTGDSVDVGNPIKAYTSLTT